MLQPQDWKIAYPGQGEVSFTAEGLKLQPASALEPGKTHAALVLSETLPLSRFFEVDLRFQNRRPLRVGAPNPWEVFWLFFNYQTARDGKKKTNYLILKPNGIEVGRATKEVDQVILKTWNEPVIRYGEEHRLRLKRWGTKLIIQADEHPELVYEFIHDSQQPFDQKGQIGLYSEDAEVLIRELKYKPL